MRLAAIAVNATCVGKTVLEKRDVVAAWRKNFEGVAGFGSGKVCDEIGGFLTPTACPSQSILKTTKRHFQL